MSMYEQLSREDSVPSNEGITDERIAHAKTLLLNLEQYQNHPFTHAKNPEQFYMFQVESGAKRISYFGTSHTNDPSDPQFVALEDSFYQEKPDIVLVEGLVGINEQKENVREILRTTSREELIKTYGEAGEALQLAEKAGCEFESPEPLYANEIVHLAELGYSRKDIFRFYLHRQIYQYQREHEQRSLDELTQYLQSSFEEFVDSSGYDRYEIEDYRGELLSDVHLDSDEYDRETDPKISNEERTVINEISFASSQFRDAYIVERIGQNLKQHDKIFVVYGFGHAITQERALQFLVDPTAPSLQS